MIQHSTSDDQHQIPNTHAPGGPNAQPQQASQPRATTDPSLDKHQRQGFTGSAWIALIFGALILVMLLVFVLQNTVAADFAYIGWTFRLPLGVTMLFAGMLVMRLFGSLRLLKVRHRVRRLEQERKKIQNTLSSPPDLLTKMKKRPQRLIGYASEGVGLTIGSVD